MLILEGKFALLYSMLGVTETAHYYSYNTENSKILVRSHPGYNHQGIIFCLSVIIANVDISSKKGNCTLRKQADYAFN